MNAPRPRPTALHHCLLALGLLVALALSGCAPAGEGAAGGDEADGFGATASCEEPAQLDAQVRLDTDAILAGIAHARAHLGMQEDATP